MKRRRTFNSGRHRSLYALANQPRSSLKRTTWTPTPAQEAKRTKTCRCCGAGGPIHLHHIVPRSLSRAGKYAAENVLGLCAACHDGFHAGTPIPRSILTPDELAFAEKNAPSIGWLGRRYPRKEAA